MFIYLNYIDNIMGSPTTETNNNLNMILKCDTCGKLGSIPRSFDNRKFKIGDEYREFCQDTYKCNGPVRIIDIK